MKVSRKVLKALIKECLLELLTEGLGDQLNEAVKVAPTRPCRKPSPAPQEGGGILTSALKNAVLMEAGSDPVMQDILADTAMTTLPTRLANERSDGSAIGPAKAGLAEQVVAEMEPEQLVGEENASRWAALAFDVGSPKVSMLPPPPASLSVPTNLDAPVGRSKKTA
jgi:hypothetical protein